MATIQDVVEMAEMFNVDAVFVDEDRCAAVRNRNSKCRKCADVCVCGAIVIGDNQVKLDSRACVNCGACVNVCPNQVFYALQPAHAKLLDACRKAGLALGAAQGVQGAEGVTCVIACERKASRAEADPAMFAQVPCLAHVTEWLLVELAARGAGEVLGAEGVASDSYAPYGRSASFGTFDILLVDGNCETCKYGQVSALVDAACAGAADLLLGVGKSASIERGQSFPAAALVSEKHADMARGKSRRGLLAQTGSYVKNVAGNVAEKTISDKLGIKKAEKSNIKSRLGVGSGARMPAFEPLQSYEILDALCGVGQPVPGARVFTRRFGSVEIDAQKCSGCGLCVMFCPTHALGYDDYDEPADEAMRYLEFRCVDCTQCGLCADVCLRDAVQVSPEVEMNALFDFEPRLIEIPKPQKSWAFGQIRK